MTASSSTPIRTVVLVGNPRPASRTRAVATALAAEVAAASTARDVPIGTIDLAEFAGELVGVPSAGVAALIDTVTTADVVFVATPVYKAAYTGLLKTFLDQLPGRSLAGVVAVPVTVSAAPTHRFAADAQLRPVLTELGASLPVPSFTIEERELDDVVALAERWAAANAGVVAATSDALRALRGARS